MFIQTEETQDSERLRFLPGREVLPEGTLNLKTKEQAATSPLAEQLFAIPGVAGVLLNKDSIVVTRSGSDWQHLKPAILGAIIEHFMSGAPVVRTPPGAAASASASGEENDATATGQIREALRRVIDPELGYNIVDLGLVYDVTVEDGGVTIVTMTTTTPGCPATNYLKTGAGEAASSVDGVEFVDVRLTYEPRWTPDMMTSEAKAHLGIGSQW
jgi:metal-sulfur cluster biosynthetic enzyme